MNKPITKNTKILGIASGVLVIISYILHIIALTLNFIDAHNSSTGGGTSSLVTSVIIALMFVGIGTYIIKTSLDGKSQNVQLRAELDYVGTEVAFGFISNVALLILGMTEKSHLDSYLLTYLVVSIIVTGILLVLALFGQPRKKDIPNTLPAWRYYLSIAASSLTTLYFIVELSLGANDLFPIEIATLIFSILALLTITIICVLLFLQYKKELVEEEQAKKESLENPKEEVEVPQVVISKKEPEVKKIDPLEQLEKLRESNLITEEEYQERKNNLDK